MKRLNVEVVTNGLVRIGMLIKTGKDNETSEWRKANRTVAFEQLQKLADKAYRRSRSEKSRENILFNTLIFCS